ncbi:MAG TPA: site-specific integrase [Polyangia bacterium]|nr:site-specific integrase [Polyangia bacterium]
MNSLLDVVARSQRWSRPTRLVYQNAVLRFLEFAGGALTGAAVERWRDHLLNGERLEPATVHKLLAAVRAVSRRHAALTHGPDFASPAELPKLDPWTPPSPPVLADVGALLDEAEHDRSPLGLRDRPVIRLMALTAGERVGEVCGHRNGDLVEAILSIRRKGGWTQQVQVDQDTLDALHEWIAWRGENPDDPMFIKLRRSLGDEWEASGPLTSGAVARMLARRCRSAGIKRVIRPHDLRRFFISALLDGGAKPHETMLAAGHKSLSTTSRYVGRVDAGGVPAGTRIASMLGHSKDKGE